MTEATLRALASAVFGGRCGFGLVRVDFADPAALLGEETDALRTAIPARAREFAAGRIAARQALGRRLAIPMGRDRAPVWPQGWAGSISHAAGWAVAIARDGGALIGVDLEPDEDLPEDILPEILTPAERMRLGADLRLARRIFAIKEAVYTAQYPVTRQVFDFQTLEISLSESRFFAEFRHSVGPFARGSGISGGWASGGGLILAGVLD